MLRTNKEREICKKYSAMTLDEAIAHAREIAQKNRDFDVIPEEVMSSSTFKTNCLKCAEEHEQIAEWLEELKSYRASVFSGEMTQAMLREEYNKAIDDFEEKLLYQIGDLGIREIIEEIAEQLKAGVKID